MGTIYTGTQNWPMSHELRTGGSGRIGVSSVREGTSTVDTSQEMEAEDARKHLREQIPYDNVAGRGDVGDRAVAFAREHRTQYESKMASVYKRWGYHASMMNGNSVADTWGLDPVHVPEGYKAREAIVTRLEEAIFGQDPAFDVVGLDRIDRKRAIALRGWLMFCLARIDYDLSVQPALRGMMDTSLYMRKWYWDYRDMDGVEVKRTPVQGDVWEKTKIERKRKKIILANHPNFDLINPYHILVDTRFGRETDQTVMGDETFMTAAEILHLIDVGIYVNLTPERLRSIKPSGKPLVGAAEAHRQRNSRTGRADFANPPVGSPALYRVSERWGWFDLYGRGDGYEVEACVTTIEDEVCVRAIENFYDTKMRPYSIGRVSEEWHEFFTTSPADHAITLSAELDAHRTLALEAHKLSVCPHFVAEEDGHDMPDSILGLLPGSVLTGGKGQFMRPPDTLSSWPVIEHTLKQDIQEVWGSPNLYFGQDTAGTATEIERRTQEGNKRIAGLYRNVGRAFRRDLEIVHALSAQFVTSKQQFHVLGRTAKLLGPDGSSSISPMDFEPKVDFRILGLAQMHTLGGRAAAIANFMGRNAELLLAYQDRINIPELLAEDYRLTVGARHEDEIFQVDRSLEEVASPEWENTMMRDGQQLEVHPLDVDEEHMEIHEDAANEAKRQGNWKAHAAITAHNLNHQNAARQKELKRQAAAARAPSQTQPAMQPQNGTPRPSDMGGEGTAPRQTPKGEAAGPPAAGKTASAGRKQPQFQTDKGAGR